MQNKKIEIEWAGQRIELELSQPSKIDEDTHRWRASYGPLTVILNEYPNGISCEANLELSGPIDSRFHDGAGTVYLTEYEDSDRINLAVKAVHESVVMLRDYFDQLTKTLDDEG